MHSIPLRVGGPDGLRNIPFLAILVAGMVAAPEFVRGAAGIVPEGAVIHREGATFVRDTFASMDAPQDNWCVWDKNNWGVQDGGEVHRNAMSFSNGVLRLAVQPKKNSDADYPGTFPATPHWTGHYASKMGEDRHYNEDAPTCQTHKYGRFEVRWKAAAVGGTVSSFFTIHHEKFPGTDEEKDWSEFDFEFFSRTNILNLNLHYTDREVDVWNSHRQTAKELTLDFDPTADFHTYAYEWPPDSLTWLIEEKPVRVLHRQSGDGLRFPVYPHTMHTIYLILWPNAVSPGQLPSVNKFDSVAYYRMEQTAVRAVDYSSGRGVEKREHRQNDLFYRYLGGLDEGDEVTYRSVPLKHFKRVTFELAANRSGRRVEVRTGSATGPVIATIDVPNTGDWRKFQTVTADIAGPTASGTQDVVLTFSGGPGCGNIRSFLLWANQPRGLAATEPGLEAYYKLDELDDRHGADSSGRDRATLHVGEHVRWVPGRFGNALQFERSYTAAHQ